MAIGFDENIIVTTGGKLSQAGSIQGTWQTVDTISDMYAFTGSTQLKQNLADGQVFYISSSQELYITVVRGNVPFQTYRFDEFSYPGSGGGSVNTGSLLTTASVAGTTMTFTKGDNSTFDVTLPGGSGGTPGSPSNSIQFNDGGNFGGDPRFIFEKTTGLTQLSGSLQITGSTDNVFLIKSGSIDLLRMSSSGALIFADLDHTPAAIAGGLFYSSSNFYVGVE